MPTKLLAIISDAAQKRAGGNTLRVGVEAVIVVEAESERVMQGRLQVGQVVSWSARVPKLVENIEQYAVTKATLLGHHTTFAQTLEQRDIVKRMADAEESVRRELVSRKRQVDVEVYAFHHVSLGVHSLISRQSLDEPDILYGGIVKRIEEEVRLGVKGQFSVLKHDFMKVFNPIDVRLQLRDGHMESLAGVDFAEELRRKLPIARSILRRIAEAAPGSNEAVEQLRQLLDDENVSGVTRSAGELRQWLVRMNDVIDGLRNAEQAR
jgi:hypothetical protein